ncbi:unnamed protein product, partial [Protopolystoma xenopodis]
SGCNLTHCVFITTSEEIDEFRRSHNPCFFKGKRRRVFQKVSNNLDSKLVADFHLTQLAKDPHVVAVRVEWFLDHLMAQILPKWPIPDEFR